MRTKKDSKKDLNKIICKNKELLNISGAHIISIEKEMKEIMRDIVELDKKISFLL